VANWKRILLFGLPVMSADFLSMVILKVDLIPLSILVPSAQVAMFQIVLNIANTMRNIPQATDPILMPVVVEMRRNNNSQALENIYAMIIRVTLFLSSGFFILMAVFGTVILAAYGNDFIYAATALTVACFGIAVHTVFSSIEPVLVMSGFPYLNLFNSVFFVTINLVLDFFLIPSYGILGAAVGSAVSCLATAGLQLTELYMKLRLKPLRWNILSIFLLSGIFYLAFKVIQSYFSANEHQVIIQITGMIFFGLSYLFVGWKWFLQAEERSLFAAIAKRR
jgi:O-antigen/teichoic acid export membrane protein